ncbi:MAG: Fic family protein [Limisphaerales bacterium]
MFSPVYRITPATAKALMSIEADRQAVGDLPIDVTVLAKLRETARLVSTHYSTQIEGNKLTQEQVKQAVAGAKFPGRERDEREVRFHYQALEHVEKLAAEGKPLTERQLQRIHGLVMTGRAYPTPYRPEQNVIRDSLTRTIVYLPPEAKEVPKLMADLVEWINRQLYEGDLPVPVIASLGHYQFATIHPYYDGNGRTARLLANLILHKAGYGLKGIYSLDEYYARNLQGYYAGLTVGPSHNYHLGRAEADVTGFLEYFCQGMADAFRAVRLQAAEAAKRGGMDRSEALSKLDPRQRLLLQLFKRQTVATAEEIAIHLRLSHRTIVGLCRDWLKSGFLELHEPSRKRRSYQLERGFQQFLA